MNGPGTVFKRMVVGLPQSMANNTAVEVAANLAELLHIDLHATFVADSALRALAEFSAVRELRTLGQGWHSIDLARISGDIDRAASAARRGFTECVKDRAIKATFDVITAADAIASLIRADDIVAIIEPDHPAETITRQFTDLVDAVLKSAAAVLTVPRRIVRTAGPILAVATGPDDPSIGIALKIAVASKEHLIVLTRPGVLLSPQVHTDAEYGGVRVEQVIDGSNRSMLGARECLRVMTRGRQSTDARRLFSTLHGIPLLVIEPPDGAVEQRSESGR
jgi:hypothetical protein